jgi:hypothetical protein
MQLDDIILVKEGFSFLAAAFHCFWALYQRMWLVSFILLAINIFLIFLETKGYVRLGVLQPIRFGFLLFVGSNFNDWHRYAITKKGYVFQGVVSGKNEDEASYKFLQACCSATPLVLAKALQA